MTNFGLYRKHNDHQHGSRKYNKIMTQDFMRNTLKQEAQAEIREFFEPTPDPIKPEYHYVVEAYLADGDKPWLDGYEIVGITSDLATAEMISGKYKKSFWEYRELTDFERKCWL